MSLPCAILTEPQVKAIKAAIWSGAMQEELADKYGVNFRSISNIKNGITWPDILWPNGKKGAISKERALEITKARMKSRAVTTTATNGSKAAKRKKGKGK